MALFWYCRMEWAKTKSFSLSYLFLDHPELLVHRLEVVPVEPGPVEGGLEVPEGEAADGLLDAGHEGGH